ncbi:MFS transporter [Halopenitus sp. POP-27]|uniref:MFS transporter n=1 Tax=Halopenitus sp. POP-27 TaxID=2994425 RepID=UPI002468CD0F|nr:MFS transporter [Halopenitus sp. POP-27]
MKLDYTYRSIVLLLCTLAFFVTAFGRLALSPLVPLITADFGISNTEIGIALSGMWAAYSFTQFPSGFLADRYGERTVILAALTGTAVTSLIVAFAPVYVVFLLGTILLGAVGGLHYSAATALLSRLYDNTGMAIGVHNIGMPAGGLIAPAVASWVGIQYGWRPAAVLVILTAVPVFVLFAWTVRVRDPPRPEGRLREAFDHDQLAGVLWGPSIGFTICIGIVAMFAATGLFTFIPTFLVQYGGYSPTIAGAVFTAFFVVLIPLQVVVGRVADAYGEDATLASCFFAGWGGILLLILRPEALSLVVGTVLIAVGSSSVAVIDSRLVNGSATETVGTEFGLPRTIYGVFGGTGAIVVGALADVFTWELSFGFLASILLGMGCLVASNELFALGY